MSHYDHQELPLPLDIFYHLAVHYLAHVDVLTLARTCRTLWHSLYADGYAPIWRALYRRDLSKLRVPDPLHAKVQGVIMSDLTAMMTLPRFLEAVRRGYDVIIPVYLSQLVPTVRSEALNRALGEAARNGHTDVFDWILTQQFEFDLYDALSGSAEAHRYDLLKKLVPLMTAHLPSGIDQAITASADPVSDCFRLSPRRLDAALYGASKGGHVELVRKLLAIRSDENFCSTSAVQGAAEGGHEDLLNELLIRRLDRDNAVNYAARGGHDRLVRRILWQGGDIESALIGATVGGHLELFRKLHRRGGKNLDTALEAAAYHGHLDILNFILTLNLDLKENVTLYMSLIYAIERGHRPIVRRLLDLGARFYAQAITSATSSEYPEIADILTQWATDHPEAIIQPRVEP
jgi:hypothetical protein